VKGRIALKALHKESYLRFQGKDLHLQSLVITSGARVSLYTDQTHQVLLEVRNSPTGEVALDIPEKKFTLTVKDMVLLNEQGTEIPFITRQPTHTLEVISSFHNLIFEPQKGASFNLVLNFSQQIAQVPIPLVVPRLKVSHLDFTEEAANNTKITKIHQLWITPVIPEEKKEGKVYLEAREEDVFTLQSLSLSPAGLHCELTGKTNTLKTGKDGPNKNRVPSLLFSVLYSEPLKKIIELIKEIGGIVS
jgi:hypothetical protein